LLNSGFVKDSTEKIDNALTMSMAVACIAVGSIGVELILILIVSCVCRKFCGDKVAELND
jgi:hypothetical protein